MTPVIFNTSRWAFCGALLLSGCLVAALFAQERAPRPMPKYLPKPIAVRAVARASYNQKAGPEQLPKSEQNLAPIVQAPQAGAITGRSPQSLGTSPFPLPAGHPSGDDLYRQTDEDVQRKSWGCITCHTGASDMHDSENVKLGCIDCHGGNADCQNKEGAHVSPKFPGAWTSSGNPVRSFTLLNHESPEFIRFVNPGDLRIAHISCGGCHAKEVLQVRKGMMTHGCMLWSAALYNNGSMPNKNARFGESYSMTGVPQRVQTVWRSNEQDRMHIELAEKGVVPFLDPLPRFETSQPGNILRIFEPGGRFRPEVGIPEKGEEPGRPRARLSNRGVGTENRTDPVFVGLQKTRLLDPTLNFLGTNDHPGDFRSSGCTACHVIYANDRSVTHSGPYAKYGFEGLAAAQPDTGPADGQFVKNIDPTIPKDEPGHPVAHKFTTAIPTSQCIVCHMHPGTTVLNEYLGMMWWDNETDGELMYPAEQKNPTAEEMSQAAMSNPEESAARGNWGDEEFLRRVPELNSVARHTQFADFHGHGWVFRAVFKKDRQGNLLDHAGKVVTDVTTEKLKASVVQPGEPDPGDGRTLAQCKANQDDMPVHLMDIHLEKGMHCIDCHFNQDNHGNTKLYGEVRAAIEITCTDCHGTAGQSIPEKVRQPGGKMVTTGPASPAGGTDLLLLRTPHKPRKPRFEVRPLVDAKTGDLVIDPKTDKPFEILVQRSMVEPGREWIVKQTKDTTRPQHPHYNAKSHQAKTVRWDAEGEMLWGGEVSGDDEVDNCKCAHQNSNISCIACHSSWNPSCFGCHLSQKANRKTPQLHNEGDVTRNYTSYNFQTLRDDVFMLARDGLATGNRVNPARSSCAIHVSSFNSNREGIYYQQQTVSGSGLSGIAFSTNVPHTVRGGSGHLLSPAAGTAETKMCSDCHVSKNNDNNAIMAQLLMQGTNYVNFMGKYCWVAAGEHGLEAVVVTESTEPQAVIGSSLHRIAYPDNYHEHEERGGQLEHAHEHPGKDIIQQVLHPLQKAEILMTQARGEYLYAACGCGGLRIFDIAFIDHKGFAERITTAPVSPLGQQFYVKTQYATAVAAPTTLAPDPTRSQLPENHEQAVHPAYGYIYVTDKYEGLILVGAGTLLDGNPINNYLKRDLTFNPGGILCGARNITFVGVYAYICCDAGVVVVSLDDPKNPQITAVLGEEVAKHPVAVQAQFRYAYVCDEHEGLVVLDITDLHDPKPVGTLPLEECHNVYLARTYAYVAAGHEGLVIVDITKPDHPVVDQVYDAEGCISDLHDVKLGITYTSEFAYLADGENGLHVVQLTSPETPGSQGFSPRPTPQLVATRKLPKGGHALQISEALDRDRAVDESGNQIAVFGRVGARPLNWLEQQRMYRKMRSNEFPAHQGQLWKVSDNPYDKEVYRWTDDAATAPTRSAVIPASARRVYGPTRR